MDNKILLKQRLEAIRIKRERTKSKIWKTRYSKLEAELYEKIKKSNLYSLDTFENIISKHMDISSYILNNSINFNPYDYYKIIEGGSTKLINAINKYILNNFPSIQSFLDTAYLFQISKDISTDKAREIWESNEIFRRIDDDFLKIKKRAEMEEDYLNKLKQGDNSYYVSFKTNEIKQRYYSGNRRLTTYEKLGMVVRPKKPSVIKTIRKNKK